MFIRSQVIAKQCSVYLSGGLKPATETSRILTYPPLIEAGVFPTEIKCHGLIRDITGFIERKCRGLNWHITEFVERQCRGLNRDITEFIQSECQGLICDITEL